MVKAKVPLEVLYGLKTAISRRANIRCIRHRSVKGKRQVQPGAGELFKPGRVKGERGHEDVQAKLYEEVGRLKMGLDWKKLLVAIATKRQWIVSRHTSWACERRRFGDAFENSSSAPNSSK